MAPKSKEGDVVWSFNANWISWTHTALAYAAFVSAFIVGVSLHYRNIVQNEHYGYPEEWFPSVSATIGDRFPERSFFMLFIALTSGPRFALVSLYYLLTRRPKSKLPAIVFGTGVFRTLTCGGWTYITSTDNHDYHDIFMVSYLFATLPWTAGCLALSPPNPTAIRYRKILAGLFYGTLFPAAYYFLQHKIHRVAGAYTTYAFFEWALVLFDVAFDAVTALDFATFEVVVRDVKGLSRGDARLLKDEIKEKERAQALVQTSTFEGPYYWPALLDATADVYSGFVFWSMLTGLGVTIWYFPLWYMGLSGWEVFVMAPAAPVWLGIPAVRSAVIRNIRVVQLASLIGLLAFLVEPPVYRLVMVACSVSLGSVAWSASLYAERGNSARLQARISACLVGFILSTVAKFACQSNNPIWAILRADSGGWNKVGLALAIPAIWRATRQVTTSGGDYIPTTDTKGSPWMTGVGLGGLFYCMHSLLSDSSTMISWVWDGYPVTGPLAVPHGALTIMAMGGGLWLGLAMPRLFSSWTAFGIGSVGAVLLTCYSGWTGYYGGLILTVYTMGLAPAMIAHGAQHNPAKSFGFGFLIYNLMVLFHCWVVAYAFVPFGPMFREHTDWIMISIMLQIGNGVFSILSSDSSRQRKNPTKTSRRASAYYLHILIVLQLLSIAVAYLRFPTNDYIPYHPEEKIMTAGIWTIHFTLDNDMWASERRVLDFMKRSEIDVMGLLESDQQRIIMGNRDTTQILAEELGMYADYGPGPNKHTWGAALLSKYPIVNSTHHLLPSPVGELAPAIEATLDVYGTLVDVFVFHSGQEEDVLDRELQSKYLAERMGATSRPTVLLSYLVTKPKEGNYNNYVSEVSGMHDIDDSDWDRWCQYILYKNIRRIGYARFSRGTVTDTEIQAGKFIIGPPADYSDSRVDEKDVPLGYRFPEVFKGEGINEHRYHVLDGGAPRYYA